jgi:hypothetical protein
MCIIVFISLVPIIPLDLGFHDGRGYFSSSSIVSSTNDIVLNLWQVLNKCMVNKQMIYCNLGKTLHVAIKEDFTYIYLVYIVSK